MSMFNKFMKVNISLCCFLFSLSILVFFSCEDQQPQPREYPRVRTLPVTDISDSGAVFFGDLYSLGSEEILEHGFLWDNSENPNFTFSNRVYLGIPRQTGIYAAPIKTTLKKGTKYTVRSFVKTAEHTVMGMTQTFVSKGSRAPIITGFEPDSASWGDTILVKGKYFSWLPGTNVVKLDNIQCTAFQSTDTTIMFVIPNSLSVADRILSVGIEGNIFSFLTGKLRIEKPILHDFLPKQARWGDTIIIKGKNLRIVDNSTNSVKLGTFKCSLIGLPNDSIVKVQVPYDMSTISSNISVNLNGLTINGKQNFQLLEPYFTFSPAEGTWGTKIKLVGQFNTIASKNSFYIGNSQAGVASTGARQIEILVPSNITTNENLIKYSASPFTVYANQKFILKPPEISSFSPSSGAYNTLVTITGNYFGTNITPVVKFGNYQAVISSWTNTQIKALVPNTGMGFVKITVTIGAQNVMSTTDFNMQNISISNIIPITGTFKDLVTITGENFTPSGLSVQFGAIYATVKSVTSTAVVVEVPSTIDSIPRNIRVNSGSYAISAEKFTLLPPEIFSISPSVIKPGEELTITGKNFNTDIFNESVSMGLSQLKIISASPTQIIAVVPADFIRDNFKVKLRVNGYTRFSDQLVSVNSPWLRIASPSINSYNINNWTLTPIAGAGFSNNGYLCSLVDGGATYRFEGSTKTWTKLASTPAGVSGYMKNARSIACNGSLYLIYGTVPVFTSFSEASETWSSINKNIPYNEAAVTFSLNNKIYFGTNSYSSGTANYPLYELDPLQNYLMTSKAYFPVSLGALPAACFSLNNIGYVLFPNNNFWKYDPVINTWIKLSDFPGLSRTNPVTFVLGGDAYIGAGLNSSTYLNDFWEYNVVTDSWTIVPNMPGGPRRAATAFTLNGKAYVGYGNIGFVNLYDFYEFDPSLVSK
jgi:hypothetical protein